MKRIFFILLTGIASLGSFAQMRVEYQKAINNTYKLEYREDNNIYISNVENPFEGLPIYGEWPYVIDIEAAGRSDTDIIYEQLGPYTLDLKINNNAINDTFYCFFYFGLDGRLGHIVFSYETEYDLPLEAIETLETALKEELRLKLTYKPDKVKEIHFIRLIRYFSLYRIKSHPKIKDIPLLPHDPNRPKK